MTGILFIVNVPKKEYENKLKENNISIFDKEKYDIASKVINELKEKQQENKNLDFYLDDTLIIKCRSTDCLHHCSHESDSYKCNSETTVADGLEDNHKSFAKTSWKEIKQVIAPNKNKLKINRPVRGVDILGAFRCDTPLETILTEIVARLDIKNAAWNSTRNNQFWQVIFSLESGSLSEELLQVLKTFGIGSRFQSSLSLLPCALYLKSNEQIPETTHVKNTEHSSGSDTAWSRFSSSVSDRTNLAQVLHDVRANGTLTFDWVFMLLVAAFVAAIGLVENSTVILVASMLISPLMGPITAGALGTAVKDRSLQVMGVTNEFLGLFLSLVVGFLVGLTICILDEKYGVIEDWPTDEMLSRCAHRSLWIGILVAIPSGAGCALAVLGDYTASLVGVAISASLLPPAVNAGLLWSMALTRLIVQKEEQHWLVSLPSELALLGTASLCLTLVNIICIFLSGITVYKVKEVSPLDRRDISWWKANKNRFNATRQQQKEKLEWDAYTSWCTNSLERKEKQNPIPTVNKEQDNKPSTPMDNDTAPVLDRPSRPRRYNSQMFENYRHSVPLEDNYMPLSADISLDIEKQIMPQKMKITNDISHSYYNLAFESNEHKGHCHLVPTDPSLALDEKIYGVLHNSASEIRV